MQFQDIKVADSITTIGLLGAEVPDTTAFPSVLQEARLQMIERRILAIEAALCSHAAQGEGE